jgi:hypothetical protein
MEPWRETSIPRPQPGILIQQRWESDELEIPDANQALPFAAALGSALKIFSIGLPFANSSTNLSR